MQVYPDMPWMRDLIRNGVNGVANPFLDFIRWFGYEILKLVATGVDLCSDAVNGVLSVNIMNIGPVQDFVKQFTPVAWVALTAALAAAGLYMMFYQGKNKELFRNLLLSVILMVAIPFLFTTLNQFKDAGVSDMKGQLSGGSSPGQAILQSTVVDIGSSTKGVVTLNSDINPYFLDINARLPNDGIWKYKITYVSGNAKTGYKLYGGELSTGGLFGWGAESLYAYSFHFFTPLATLLVTLIAMLFAGFKIARTMFDLIFHQAIAPVLFASDVNSGARTKKFIQNLVGLYVMILLVLMVMKIFLDVSNWVNLNVSNSMVRIMLLAGSAWGVIDGPDLVIKLLGIDAGVRSATSVILGANTAAGVVGRGVGGAAHMAGGALNAGGKAAGVAAAAPHVMSNIKAGFADAAAGGLGTTAEYGHALSKNAQGAKGFAAGQMGVTKAAKTLGYAFGKMQSKPGAEGVQQPGQGETPSPLDDAEKATAGNPSQSAEAAAAQGTPAADAGQPVSEESPEAPAAVAPAEPPNIASETAAPAADSAVPVMLSEDSAQAPAPKPITPPRADTKPAAEAAAAAAPARVHVEPPATQQAEAPAERTVTASAPVRNANITQRAAAPVVQDSNRAQWPTRKTRGDR